MLTLATIWSFVKKYWKYVALVVAIIVTYLLFRKTSIDWLAKMQEIQDAHDAEIKEIEAAREEERKRNEANIKQLRDALDAVQKKYDAEMKQFDAKKKSEVEQIVKDYGDNPDELAKQLSEATGFDVILPD